MNVLDAIERRHSVRTYEERPIPHEILVKILDAAHQAPSSWNLQPWEFVVVTDPEVKRQLRVAANNQAAVEEAGAVFVCLGSLRQQDALADRIERSVPPDATPERVERVMRNVSRMRHDQDFRKTHVLTNTYIGISFLVIAAQSFGLASVWMGGFNADQVKQILGIPDDFFVASLVAVGYPREDATQPPRKRRPLAEIQHWNRFGQPTP
ncbi:MAG: nitroreductase family protein [Bacillota bacterium]